MIYTESSFIDFIKFRRGSRATRIVVIEQDAFRSYPYASQIDAIRTSAAWLSQAAWLSESPQARLPFYNPMVLSKLPWLAEQAEDDPFGSEHYHWVDGALSHTVSSGYLPASSFVRLAQICRFFLLTCFPYAAVNEVH